jgi:hypothetical protein
MLNVKTFLAFNAKFNAKFKAKFKFKYLIIIYIIEMHPKIWGKSMWSLLVAIVLQYPDSPLFDDIHKMRRFITSVGGILPCANSCRPNFIKHMQDLPLDNFIQSRDSMIRWLHIVYNLTLADQGRKNVSIEYFLIKFDSPLHKTTNIQNAIYYIASGYPIQPNYDDIMNYQNFFTYLNDYSASWSFAKQNEVPSDKYLITRKSLQQYVAYAYNITSPPTIPADTGNQTEQFKSGNADLTNLGALVLLGTFLVGYELMH